MSPETNSTNNHSSRYLLALVLCAVVCLAAGPAAAAPGNGKGGDNGKLSATLEGKAASGKADLVDVIIIYKEHPGRSEGDRIRGLGGSTRIQYRNFTHRAARVDGVVDGEVGSEDEPGAAAEARRKAACV